MSEYTPSFSVLGSFLGKALHGLENTMEMYSEALSGFRKRLSLTTVFPSSLSDTVLSIESDLFLQMCETLSILSDRDFMSAIAKGREDVREGRVHNFSELLAEYGLE